MLALTMRRLRKSWVAYIFILPNLIVFLTFGIFPLVWSFFMSFNRWSMTKDPVFIGMDNYTALFSDEVFVRSLKNTAEYTVLYVGLGVIFSLCLALLLNTLVRGRGVFTLIYYLPVVTSVIVIALIWKVLFASRNGIVNFYLDKIGIQGPGWLIDPSIALITIALMMIWKGAGYNMLLFLAGLQGISQEFYEAASIDGANYWQSLRHITIPLLRPTTLFVVIIATIGSFQVFTPAYVLTQGGPYYATTTLVYFIYQQAFEFFQLGYGSAAAYVLFVIILIIALIQRRLLGWNEEVY